MKTLKDILEKDNSLSGPLTPENGKLYNHALGEPKFHTSYKVSDYALRKFAKEHIKYLRKQEKLHWEFVRHCVGKHPDGKVPKGFDKENSCGLPYGYKTVIIWIQKTFDLEVDKDEKP